MRDPKGAPERTALYRLYDEAGTLLYVGITNNPAVRWRQHALRQWWWPEVATRSIEWFADRESAGLAEKAEIQGKHPPYNRSWNLWEIRGELMYQDRLRARAASLANLKANPPEWHKTGLHDPD